MRTITVILLLLTAFNIHAQTVGGVPAKGLDMQTNSGGFVTQLPMAPAETKGDVYLNNQWFATDITLANKSKLKGFLTRLNLETNQLQINVNDQIRVLSFKEVSSFSWLDGNLGDTVHFVSGKDYRKNGVPIDGFFQILKTGTWTLLSKPTLVLIKNTYVAALDAGERNNKWVKRDELYILNQTQLFNTNLSKNKFISQFPSDLQGAIKDFQSSKKIGNKNLGDLLLITDYLNSSKI